MTQDNHQPQRREFLLRIGAAAGCAALAPLAQACEVTEVYDPKPLHVTEAIDLSAATYAPLATVGGSVKLTLGNVDGVLVRITDSTIVGLTSTCTHKGCSLDWNSGAGAMVCGCHGAKFSASGKVLTKPSDGSSIDPLPVWTVSFDATTGKGTVKT